MAVAGLFIGVLVLIVLAVRGFNIILATIFAAIFVALITGVPLVDALQTHYAGKAFGFAGQFFLLFLAGAVFGQVMAESQAAASIAHAFSRWWGPHRTLYIATVVTALLTYFGVNVFVVIFAVYPVGLVLMQQANMPKRLFAAAASLGAGTFTMTAMPAAPSIHNIIMSRALGTPLWSGAVPGLIASVVMLALGLLYLERERRKAEARGEGFRPGATDRIPDKVPDAEQLPSAGRAFLPMLVIPLLITLPLMLSIVRPPSAEGVSMYDGFVRFVTGQAVLWTSFAMAVATLVALALFWKRLLRPTATLSRGAEASILPLIYTAVVIGFGGVVAASPPFLGFREALLAAPLPPLLSAVLGISSLAAIMASASGSLQIFATEMAPQYIAMGVDKELLHRIVCIASGGLDSLPHCGAVVMMLTIMGMTHREAYKDVAVITIVVPLIALAVTLGFVFATGG